jgi:signal transduction histidine kinase
LRIATAQVTRAQQAVANLIHQRTEQLLQSLVEDLRSQAQLIGDLYKIPVVFTASELPRTEISLVGGNELLYACDEVIGNALRHAQPTRLAITIGFCGDALEVQICDDGIGFDASRTTPGLGLYSIQQRIKVLNGTTTIESQPHAGTRVTFCVPLHAPGEAKGGEHAR